MAKNENRILKDGWTHTLGGVDSSRAATLLLPDEHSWALNCVFRGGYAENRPPFVSHRLSFPTDEVKAWWEGSKLLQEATVYNPPDRNAILVAKAGGRLFTIDVLGGYEVKEITPTKTTTITADFIAPAMGANITISVDSATGLEAGYPVHIGSGRYSIVSVANLAVTVTNQTADPGINTVTGTQVVWLDRNPQDRPQAWMEQAEQYLIVQNGSDEPIIFDGASARRADPTQREVPTGTAMVYNEEIGRLCVCVAGNEIAIGDIAGTATDAVLKFTETTYLAEGGKFRVPNKFGRVTAMVMMSNLDRSNGQGSMLAMAERGISAFNLPPTRELWKSLNYPPQINMPIRYGATSQGGIVTVNGDIFYRAKDGLRTFVMAIREFGKWGNVPVSSEMNRAFGRDDQKLLKYASGVLFDNRLLMTCSPRPLGGGAYNLGIVALDFDRLTRMGHSERPAYDGMWIGINPIKMVTGDFAGEERCFVFSRNTTNGAIELWEIKREGNFDGDNGRIVSRLESRALNFGGTDELKAAAAFELWVDRVVGEVDIDLKYRPDEASCWADWTTKEICNAEGDCVDDDTGECRTITTYKPGYRSRMAFGTPPQACEGNDNKPMSHGYSFQVRLQWTGRARIKKGIMKARPLPEPAIAPCD